MIRRAETKDIPRLMELLSQVLEVHAAGRPDIFISGTTKYSPAELEEILGDDARPVFVSTDEEDRVLGYAFCVIRRTEGVSNLRDRIDLYVDDLCVDESHRGEHVASGLFRYLKAYAAERGCGRILLNVWELNGPAREFYGHMGMRPLRTVMETLL